MTTFAQVQLADTPSASPEPIFWSAESTGVVAVVMDFVGATLPQLDHLLGKVRLDSGGTALPGSLFQWSRGTADGVRVTGVWQSSRHFEAFLDDIIAPLLCEVGIRTPDVTTYSVHSYLTQGTLGDRED